MLRTKAADELIALMTGWWKTKVNDDGVSVELPHGWWLVDTFALNVLAEMGPEAAMSTISRMADQRSNAAANDLLAARLSERLANIGPGLSAVSTDVGVRLVEQGPAREITRLTRSAGDDILSYADGEIAAIIEQARFERAGEEARQPSQLPTWVEVDCGALWRLSIGLSWAEVSYHHDDKGSWYEGKVAVGSLMAWQSGRSTDPKDLRRQTAAMLFAMLAMEFSTRDLPERR